jgi:hypothetical protein
VSFFQEITQPGVAPIVGAMITAVVSINTMFLKWLVDSFRGLRKDITDLAKSHQQQIDEHEEKDQVRHEENLKRFETISIALTRLDANAEAEKITRNRS